MRECRIIERISPALYSNEIAYQKTKRSLNYFEKIKANYGKEYIMSLTNFIGVGIYTIGVVMDSDVSWDNFYLKACEGLDFLNNNFVVNIYGIPKLINNYILIGILSNNLQLWEGIELYNLLLSDEAYVPSKPLIICNQIILKFLRGDTTDILESMQELFSNTDSHEYYHFIVGINYLNILITCNDYEKAKDIFNELDYLIPAISIMDKSYIIKHYNLLEKIISEKIIFSSVKEYCHYFSSSIHPANVPYPDVWKNPYVFSDLQYWSEY